MTAPWWSWSPSSDWTNDWSYGNYYNGRPLYARKMEKERKRQKKIKANAPTTKPPQVININVEQARSTPQPIPTIDTPPLAPAPTVPQQQAPSLPPQQPPSEPQIKTPEVILPSQI